MWTHFSKWLIMATFCAVFSFASPFPTCASKSALLASMWLGLKPSWPTITFTMCLLKDDMGTDKQLLTCAKYPHTPYIVLPWLTSINEQGGCARYWRRSGFHAWLDAWLIFQMVASDSSSRIKIRFFLLAGKCLKPCPWVTHGTTHKRLMHGGICGNTSWQNSPACGMAVHDKVWPWTLGNTVRLTFTWWKMAPCIRSALTCMMLTFCAWYYPRVLRETGAKTCETGAKKCETGAKKTCTTWPSCFDRHDVPRVFVSEQKAPPCGLEPVGGMLFQPEPSQFFHRTFEFMHWLHSHFTWTPGAHVSGFCHV